jgi:hypothetical protein
MEMLIRNGSTRNHAHFLTFYGVMVRGLNLSNIFRVSFWDATGLGMGDIHRCLPNIDVLISIFDILTSMVFFFKRQYFIDVRNKTSNIDKKKKNKQEYSFQEMT